MIRKPSRPLLLGAFVAIALMAGGAALLFRPAATAPVTVYLTPT